MTDLDISFTVGMTARLTELIEVNGPYPHAQLDPSCTDGKKKQGTRMIKVVCPSCGYTVRTTAKWLEVGLPTCPCGEDMEADEGSGKGEGE